MERSAGISDVVAVAVQGATLLAVALTSAPAIARLLRVEATDTAAVETSVGDGGGEGAHRGG